MPAGARRRWWGDRQIRLMLEILTGRGEIAVAGRVGKQRLWDLGGARVPRVRDAALARGRARAAAAEAALARRLAGEGRVGRAPGREGGACARPSDAALAVRPPDPRPRPRRGAIRLLLPPRDVRAEGEARARLLRAAAARRGRAGWARGAALRPQDRHARAARRVGRHLATQ